VLVFTNEMREKSSEMNSPHFGMKETRRPQRNANRLPRKAQSEPGVPFRGLPGPEQMIDFNFTAEEMMTDKQMGTVYRDCLRDRLLPKERGVVEESIQVIGKHAELLVLSAPSGENNDDDGITVFVLLAFTPIYVISMWFQNDSADTVMADVVGNFNKLSLDTRALFSLRHSTRKCT
jgi:hypothetical protein